MIFIFIAIKSSNTVKLRSFSSCY